MTEVRSEFVKKRYAAERRFRFYGAAALALTALFLALLLIDTVSKGIPSFTEYRVLMDVTVDANVDPAKPATGDYEAMVKDAFRALFPDVKGRTEKKALNALLSSGAADDLRAMVVANPAPGRGEIGGRGEPRRGLGGSGARARAQWGRHSP